MESRLTRAAMLAATGADFAPGGRLFGAQCEHGQLARSCETCDLLRELDAMRARAEKAEANYRWMVEHAADQNLDGYRELGARAAAAENARDALRAHIADLEADLARIARLPTLDEANAGAAIMMALAALARAGKRELSDAAVRAWDQYRTGVTRDAEALRAELDMRRAVTDAAEDACVNCYVDSVSNERLLAALRAAGRDV